MASRPSQPPNIYVVGAQCTGKTTLVDALTKHFQVLENRSWGGGPIDEPLVIKEVARNVLKTHSFTAVDITSSPTRALELQQLILNAQQQAEDATAGAWYISDRSAMDPIVYAKVFVGKDAALRMTETEAWSDLKRKLRKGLVFVCAPNPAWLYDDGVRVMPHNWEDWMDFHRTFCASLEEQGIHFDVLNAKLSLDERIAVVIHGMLQLDKAAADSGQEYCVDTKCRGTNALL